MRKQIYIINKASGEGGGDGGDMNQYAFKTLWKEATKAVGHIMTGITQLGVSRSNNSASIAQLFWEGADNGTQKRNSNWGFYGILILVMIIALIVFIMENK